MPTFTATNVSWRVSSTSDTYSSASYRIPTIHILKCVRCKRVTSLLDIASGEVAPEEWTIFVHSSHGIVDSRRNFEPSICLTPMPEAVVFMNHIAGLCPHCALNSGE